MPGKTIFVIFRVGCEFHQRYFVILRAARPHFHVVERAAVVEKAQQCVHHFIEQDAAAGQHHLRGPRVGKLRIQAQQVQQVCGAAAIMTEDNDRAVAQRCLCDPALEQ